MRTLILLRGAPGSGKSTFIKENGLEPYTISADDLRLLYKSPRLNADGSWGIDQKVSKKAFRLMRELVESRMETGDLTIIDATHCSPKSFSQWKDLCNIYHYRCICIHFDVPRDELIKRDKKRGFKAVGVDVIDKMLYNKANNPIPGWITSYSVEEFMAHKDAIMGIRWQELSSYKEVLIVGDIHGCYTTLQELLGNTIRDDIFYIFLGDYLDRGLENKEVLQFCIDNCERKNVIFIEGNHERHLNNFIRGLPCVSDEFAKHTQPQIGDIANEGIKRFINKLAQCYAFIYDGKKYFCSHAGIPYIEGLTRNILTLPTEQFIKGVGSYEDLPEVMANWEDNPEGITQFLGHRNIQKYPLDVNKDWIPLEGRVEYGGNLRAVAITKTGRRGIELANNLFREEYNPTAIERDLVANREVDIAYVVDSMRKSHRITEKKFGRISSFNFTRTVFEKSFFTGLTCKARGLFIDTENNKVVARGYDKFFNLNEKEGVDLDKLTFPVSAFEKYNGFLGLLGYDEVTDSLVFTSKSQIAGNGEASFHADLFKRVFEKAVSADKIDSVKKILKNNNLSLAFECISHDDTHIVEYEEDCVILLDAFERTVRTRHLTYAELVNMFKEYLTIKECIARFPNIESLQKFIDSDTIMLNREGVVLEGDNGYMIKLKGEFYRFWKFIRSATDKFRNSQVWKPIPEEYSNNNETYIAYQKWYEEFGDIENDVITNRRQFLAASEGK